MSGRLLLAWKSCAREEGREEGREGEKSQKLRCTFLAEQLG